MAKVIKVKKGTTATLSEVVLEEGELAFNTETKELLIGDGVTAGGNVVMWAASP